MQRRKGCPVELRLADLTTDRLATLEEGEPRRGGKAQVVEGHLRQQPLVHSLWPDGLKTAQVVPLRRIEAVEEAQRRCPRYKARTCE